MIVALAGRRIDAPGTEAERFPFAAVELVRERLYNLLSEKGASTLVCSAACGADLLALAAARDLGIRRRIVLPFSRERFRETSVEDRPGDWGPFFDAACDEVAEQGDLIILAYSEHDLSAYSATSRAILDDAMSLCASDQSNDAKSILTVIVWEGAPRGKDDETAAFAREARLRGLAVEEILTT